MRTARLNHRMLDAFLITGWLALTAPVTAPGSDVAFCIRVDPDGYNLLHSAPCRRDDIGWTDAEDVRHHVATATTLDGLCDFRHVRYMFYRSRRL